MIPWRRERLPTPIFWPGELNGQRSLVSYTVYGVAKNQTQLSDFHFHFQEIVKCWVGRSLNTSSKAPACMLNCFSCIPLCVTLWTAACQAPLSIGSSRQEYWSGLPFSPLGDLPDPGIGSGRSPGGGKRQPTPVFLPGGSYGQRSLAGYSPQGCKESDTMRQLSKHMERVI